MSDPEGTTTPGPALLLPVAPLSRVADRERDAPAPSLSGPSSRLRVLNPWRGPWRPYRGPRRARRNVPEFTATRIEPWVVGRPADGTRLRMALRRLHTSVAHLGREVDEGSNRAVARLLRLAQSAEPWLQLECRPGAAPSPRGGPGPSPMEFQPPSNATTSPFPL